MLIKRALRLHQALTRDAAFDGYQTMIWREIPAGWAALGGALLGGFLAELHSVLQGSRERRRALRLLLNQLLEIRFEILRRDPALILELLRDLSRRYFRDASLEAIEEHPVFRNIASVAVKSFASGSLNASYSDAVKQLAPYNPLFTYRLSSDDRFFRFEAQIDNYFTGIATVPEVAADPNTPRIVGPARKAALEAAHREAVQELAASILLVAGKLWTLTQMSARSAIRRQESRPTIPADWATMFEKILREAGMPVVGLTSDGAAAPESHVG